jgi:hypothetical protein
MIKMKEVVEATSERQALWRRVKRMYDSFNRQDWQRCFSLLDPKLTEPSRVRFDDYAAQMRAFHKAFPRIDCKIEISLHLDASSNKHDPRPFAYVCVRWKDAAFNFHTFRERWVKHDGKWYTRVAGLVPNKQKN